MVGYHRSAMHALSHRLTSGSGEPTPGDQVGDEQPQQAFDEEEQESQPPEPFDPGHGLSW